MCVRQERKKFQLQYENLLNTDLKKFSVYFTSLSSVCSPLYTLDLEISWIHYLYDSCKRSVLTTDTGVDGRWITLNFQTVCLPVTHVRFHKII